MSLPTRASGRRFGSTVMGERVGAAGSPAAPSRSCSRTRCSSARSDSGGELFDGEHEALVEEALWDDVQQLLATNRRERLHGKRARSPSLLTGLITDPDGRPMTPVFTTKGARQHRYYVTRLKPGEDRKTAWRIPAGDVDRIVLNCVADAITRSAACTEPTSSERPREVAVGKQCRSAATRFAR